MADYAIPSQSIFSELVNFFQQRRQNSNDDQDRLYREKVRQEVMKATGFTPEGGPSVQGFQVNQSNLTNAERARQEQDQYKTDLQRVGNAATEDYKQNPTQYPMSMVDIAGSLSKSPEVLRTTLGNILGQREQKQQFTNQRIFAGEQNQQAIERTREAQKGEFSGQKELQQGQQTFVSGEAEKGRQFETGRETRQAGGITEVLKAMGINVPQTAGYAGPSAIAGLQRDPQTQMLQLQQLQQLTQPQVDKSGKVTRPPQIQPGQAQQLLQQNSPNLGQEILKTILQNDERNRQQVQRDLLMQELYKTGVDPAKYFAPWNK